MKLTVTTILSRFEMVLPGTQQAVARSNGMVNMAPRLPTFRINLVPRTTPLRVK
jgi:hypothetical protein